MGGLGLVIVLIARCDLSFFRLVFFLDEIMWWRGGEISLFLFLVSGPRIHENRPAGGTWRTKSATYR